METSEEEDLERILQLIAELDSEESLLLGFDPLPSLDPSSPLLALQERRKELEEELAVVWARRCSHC